MIQRNKAKAEYKIEPISKGMLIFFLSFFCLIIGFPLTIFNPPIIIVPIIPNIFRIFGWVEAISFRFKTNLFITNALFSKDVTNNKNNKEN